MKYYGKLREGQIVIHDAKIKYIKDISKNKDNEVVIKFDDETQTSNVNEIQVLGTKEWKLIKLKYFYLTSNILQVLENPPAVNL